MLNKNEREYLNKLHENSIHYLEKDKCGSGYVCPLCKSGAGPNGTGMTMRIVNGIPRFTCWSCQQIKSNDILDIIGLCNGIPTGESFSKKIELSKTFLKDTKIVNNIEGNLAMTNYNNFYTTAHNNVKNTNYWTSRGINQSTIDKYNLGYDSCWKHPKAPYSNGIDVVIIPNTEFGYAVRQTKTDEKDKYKKVGTGLDTLFGLKNLTESTDKPVFIVEGYLDALSILQCGHLAVALGGTAHKEFIRSLQENKPSVPLILSLDNDEAGKENEEKLYNELNKRDVPSFRISIVKNIVSNTNIPAKDANDAMRFNKEAFAEKLMKAEIAANSVFEDKKAELAKQNEASLTANNLNVTSIYDFNRYNTKNSVPFLKNQINENKNAKKTLTGFPHLDEKFNGGLRNGLYVIGAVSGIGKTSFVLQIADNIAPSKSVLLFSLEMSKAELMSRSISRLTYTGNKMNSNLHRTSTNILYSDKTNSEQQEAVDKAFTYYENKIKNLYIIDTEERLTIEKIKEIVDQFIKEKGETPVVIIDYLQLIQSDQNYTNEKQVIDYNVTGLKQISAQRNTPVIAISSFNRDNYHNYVSFNSFKGSGGIEYGADIVIGLQYDIPNRSDKDKVKQRIQEIKAEVKDGKKITIESVILKQRNGATGSMKLSFAPMYNYFEERKAA